MVMSEKDLSVAFLDDGSVAAARKLVAEYGDSINVDLSFQNFDAELQNFPGDYQPPRGGFLVALDSEGTLAGCVGLRALAVGCCEMKRLYVRDAYRGRRVGLLLANAVITHARQLGYRAMRLDTLASMQAAHGLYRRLGFVQIPAYTANPIQGTVFFELTL